MTLRAALIPLFSLALLVATGCETQVIDDDDGDDNVGAAESSVTPCETPQRLCDGGVEGGSVQFCTVGDDGAEEWTECCEFIVTDCECKAPWDGDDWKACDTPLVLAFEGQAVLYSTEMAGSFDLTGVGMSVATDWPTAATPWLALDRDGSGSIDGGGELFGSATTLPGGERAPNGFAALAPLDDNGDGVIDAADPAFARLLIWRDRDASRSSTAAELSPASSELVSIDLGYKLDARCDARGNCEKERSAFRFVDSSGTERTGSVIDVHLRRQ